MLDIKLCPRIDFHAYRTCSKSAPLAAASCPELFSCGVLFGCHCPLIWTSNLFTTIMWPSTGCGRYLRTNCDTEQKSPLCTIVLMYWNETIHRYSTNPFVSVYSMKRPSAPTVTPMWLQKGLHAQIRGASCIMPVTCTMASVSGCLVSSGPLLVSSSKTPHT